jgi:uncharacterized protein (TIGR03435 family)
MRKVRFEGGTLALLAVCMQAQPNAPGRREFEVASVRQFQGPHVPHGVSLNVSHGRVSVNAGSVRQLVALAYGIQRAMVEGGPDWSDRDEFNIIAKAENEGASNPEIQEMLQTLLADRFKLGVRRETKDLSGYALVPVKSGSKLKLAKDEEVTAFKAVMNGLIFQKMPIAGLASYLANLAGSPVQDLTGLTELYDFSLDLTPPPGAQPELQEGNVPLVVNRFVRVSTAVEEQLGLKVEARKASAEVMVINHAEHPSEN